MSLSDFSKQDWHRATVTGALVGGLLAGALCWTLSAATPWLAALLGFAVGTALFALLITLVGSVNVKLNDIRASVVGQVDDTRNELRAMVNVRPLVDDDILLQYGGWAMDAHLGETIMRLLLQERPQHVVECGSGSSTLLVASRLKKLGGDRRITALDHKEKYAGITRGLLKQHDLDDRAEVLTAPLEPWKLNGQNLPWYGFDLDVLPDQPIDLLIVDGPPGWDKPEARYPAVPVLRQHLANECTIVLDDGDRAGERETAHQWAEELSAELEYAGGPKGTWILRRNNA
jgi:predicted O-methyltransferase YrrM